MLYRPKWDGNLQRESTIDPEISKTIYKRAPGHAKKISTPHNKFGILIKPIEDWDLLTAWAHGGAPKPYSDSPLKSFDNLSPAKPSQSHTPATGISTQLQTPLRV
jgi:hypothetical protein